MPIKEAFESNIIKDIFSFISKTLIGIITTVELYYIFVDKFKIPPSLFPELTKTNLDIFSIIIIISLVFIIGYITCALGLALLNFFALISMKIFRESFYKKFLPHDPFSKGYQEQNLYYKHMFEVVCKYLKLDYNLVGIEFFRLCTVIALENDKLFKQYLYSFEFTFRRGLIINSLILFIISIINTNLLLFIISMVLLIVFYNSNKNLVDEWRETIYDLAFFIAAKKQN